MMALQQSVSLPWPSWPDWEEESDPQLKDLVLVPVFALVFPTVRYLLDKYILEVCSNLTYTNLYALPTQIASDLKVKDSK